MKLSELIRSVSVEEIVGDTEKEIVGVAYDSRKVRDGSLFVAMRGAQFDGHRFIVDAMGSGASAVVLEDKSIVDDEYFLSHHTTKLLVPSTRRALALISANFFDWPSKKLKTIGVTGTNGKTTSTYLIEWMLRSAGEKVLLMGTIKHMLNGETLESAVNTTPESFELNRMMAAAAARNATYAVMEVSSHSLVMDRVYGIPFKAAMFTNLTQDHLDFHHTMEEYFKAKRILFDSLSEGSFAVVNMDDEYGERIVAGTSARKIFYGFAPQADFRIVKFSFGIHGAEITIKYAGEEFEIKSMLAGKFSSYNLAGAFATAVSLGYNPASAAEALCRVPGVKGRFERIDSGKGFLVVVDYAHTPDSLQKTLQSAREILTSEGKGGRLITVFGCGGNRDRTKRPKMGKIAEDLSDVTIVTSDNPRFEDPGSIIDEILEGVKPDDQNVLRIVDRSEAIKKSLSLALPNDIVVLAGKGHENYQDIKGAKHHFDDREEAEKALGLSENYVAEKS
ncbi:MAG TPA: UDP-N-acetylmuramoyl-L-alanyl-D-glutamate--2,6-diaminopimelate ligase [Candidatus Acidoferrales bacterium]|nr:UDP-N-acetylmuramoyl-L-alanyl-D-glutamate--2,6-diaminopimelate ligase [Candidatus Acidoferrales bacterium]